MAEQLSWTLRVQVAGGPKIAAAGTLDLEAYGKIEVEVGPDGGSSTVAVQPGGAGTVQLLMVHSDRYGEALTYAVLDDTDTVVRTVVLDAPQLLVGGGAISLLDEPPRTLRFTNDLAQAAAITILVGRNVT